MTSKFCTDKHGVCECVYTRVCVSVTMCECDVWVWEVVLGICDGVRSMSVQVCAVCVMRGVCGGWVSGTVGVVCGVCECKCVWSMWMSMSTWKCVWCVWVVSTWEFVWWVWVWACVVCAGVCGVCVGVSVRVCVGGLYVHVKRCLFVPVPCKHANKQSEKQARTRRIHPLKTVL